MSQIYCSPTIPRSAAELIAAEYIASVFRRLGLETAPGQKHIIPVTLERTKFTTPPRLKFTSGGKEVIWTHGKEMVARSLASAQVSGKLFPVDNPGGRHRRRGPTSFDGNARGAKSADADVRLKGGRDHPAGTFGLLEILEAVCCTADRNLNKISERDFA